jgi:hydrogenase maturation protein HypF
MSNRSKGNNPATRTLRIAVHGTVQGIGFRPAVFRLAHRTGIRGFVANSAHGAIIEAEGRKRQTEEFVRRLGTLLPGKAHIARLESHDVPFHGYREFSIEHSRAAKSVSADLPADLATCPDCLRELFDPRDRRHLYPFINCTQCGPRFTIVTELPYDRPQTTMTGFTQCPSCAEEYGRPADRRFHAQPNACPTCGPAVRLLTAAGEEVASATDALKKTITRLAAGRIVAIKSLGGYHLACDASNAAAVRRLRRRKERPGKPFALMARDMAAAKDIAAVGSEERRLLTTPVHPIVLLRKKKDAVRALPTLELIAGDNPAIGIMLPYTPLHYLLFAHELQSRLKFLVMTSGNRRDEPIARTEDDARTALAGIADFFLVHDRPVHNRCDDSIVAAVPGQPGRPIVIRRSRGFVPDPVALHLPAGRKFPSVFAAGAEMKNTFCLTRDKSAYVSPYIGELDNEATLAFYRESFERFGHFLAVTPRVMVRDLHPDYLSSVFVRNTCTNDPAFDCRAIQHHQAHIASVLAETGILGPVLGFAFDGTGLGSDGAIWGGECFNVRDGRYRRIAHFEYFPLPGGESAIREPWRVALGLLKRAGITAMPRHIRSQRYFRQVSSMIDKDINCPRCSSAGRLFDGIAALIGLRTKVSFEAEAAIALEALAAPQLDKKTQKVYNFNIIEAAEGDCATVSFAPMVRAIAADIERSVPAAVIAARFHETMAAVIADLADRFSDETGTKDIVLGGGVFQNTMLLSLTCRRLAARGYSVHYNTIVPPNDGGIALGQAWLALTQEDADKRK